MVSEPSDAPHLICQSFQVVNVEMILRRSLPGTATSARDKAWNRWQLVLTLFVTAIRSSEMHPISIFFNCKASTRLIAECVDLLRYLHPAPTSCQSVAVVRRNKLVGCFGDEERPDMV